MAASLSLDPPLADAAVAIPLFAAARCSGDGIAGVRPTRWSRRRCPGTILCPFASTGARARSRIELSALGPKEARRTHGAGFR